jgi:hypothetical protein
MYIRVEWFEKSANINVIGFQMKDLGPNRAYIKYQDDRITFDPGSRALKMAIFSKKTLFVCNPKLGSFKQPLDRRYFINVSVNEKLLSTASKSMLRKFWAKLVGQVT